MADDTETDLEPALLEPADLVTFMTKLYHTATKTSQHARREVLEDLTRAAAEEGQHLTDFGHLPRLTHALLALVELVPMMRRAAREMPNHTESVVLYDHLLNRLDRARQELTQLRDDAKR